MSLTLLFGMVVSIWCIVPVQYHFDANAADTARTFGWSAQGEYIGPTRFESRYFVPRPREAWVKLPNLATYHEPSVADISIETQGGKPSAFKLRSTALTMDEVLDRAMHWATVWNFTLKPEDVDRWKKRANRGDLGPYGVTGRFSREPGGLDIWLEIRPSFDRGRPWYITLNLYWHPENEAN